MPIIPFLKDAGFGPAEIEAMSIAFEEACRELKIGNDLKVREVVARRIIELARRGERSPTKLRNRVLVEANRGSAAVG